jgi:hypothetical protein
MMAYKDIYKDRMIHVWMVMFNELKQPLFGDPVNNGLMIKME